MSGSLLAARLDAEPWGHVSGPYRALDFRFGVRTTDPVLGEYLARTFEPFLDPGGSGPVRWYSVHERSGGGRWGAFRSWLGSAPINRTASADVALGFVLWSFNREVIASAGTCLRFHAGCAARDGAAVVLPAVQESGKTTLTAGLVRRGWDYVTDECVALDRTSGELRPFPKALAVDRGSWPVLPEAAPELGEDEVRYVRDQWHVPATRLGTVVDGPVTPRLVISPRYVAGATTELRWVSRAQGLLLLADNSFAPEAWERPGLATVADVLRGARCAELVVGSLEDAVDAIEGAMDEALAGLAVSA